MNNKTISISELKQLDMSPGMIHDLIGHCGNRDIDEENIPIAEMLNICSWWDIVSYLHTIGEYKSELDQILSLCNSDLIPIFGDEYDASKKLHAIESIAAGDVYGAMCSTAKAKAKKGDDWLTEYNRHRQHYEKILRDLILNKNTDEIDE